jgi:hypothetical protein
MKNLYRPVRLFTVFVVGKPKVELVKLVYVVLRVVNATVRD